MAKKQNEEPVYPAAPLVIAKDRFVELLTAQIDKGKELLEINVPIATSNNHYMGYARRPIESVEYDAVAEKEFTAKYERWHDRNKEIYRSSFSVPNSIYFHEYEMQQGCHLVYDDIIKIYKDDIVRYINQMQSDIERVDLMKCTAAIDVIEQKHQIATVPKVFISHNEEDAPFAHALVDLMRDLGMRYEDIFCSSHPACAIPFGKSILNTMRKQFDEYSLTVLFIHSPRLYASAVSLCEMGAAWILRSNIYSFLTNDCSFDLLRGVVTKDDIAFKAGQDNTYRVLNDFRSFLEREFKLPPISNSAWDFSKQRFINTVSNIKYEEKS